MIASTIRPHSPLRSTLDRRFPVSTPSALRAAWPSLVLVLVLAAFAAASTTPARSAVAADEAVHLIICPSAFQAAFATLAQHRTLVADLPSCVVTLEEILGTAPPGRDDAETLRNYLIQQYAKGNLRYVLLGGDSGFIPVRLARSTWYPAGGSSDLESDLYYACLDGDWDADGDGIFGEAYRSFSDPGDQVDLDPELAVGRAPVHDLTQAQHFVERVIAYDTVDPAPCFGSAVILAEVLFPSNWTGGVPTLDGATYGENLAAVLQLHPYPPTVDRRYENWTGYPGSTALTVTSALQALGSGNQGLLCFIGEGSVDRISVGNGNIFNGDLDGLTNAPHYSFVVSMTSDAASFADDSILEHLVLAPQGGSAGALGFVDAAFASSSHAYLEAFFGEITAGSGVLVGDAMRATLKTQAPTGLPVENFKRWTNLSWCLLGDPGTPFRTELRPIPTESTTTGGFKSFFRGR